MKASLRQTVSVYGAYAAMVPKVFLAYSIWVWMQFVVSVIALVIFVAFWTAVYAETDSIGSLNLGETLNYIILAQIFLPIVNAPGIIYYFGQLIRDGRVGIELLRPVDFQAANYVTNIADVAVSLMTQIPLAIVAWFLFRFHLPVNPLVWLAFVSSALLGNALLFFFDWILGCLAFYSTETWGLGVLRFSVATFFSGALVPLAMMPGWLQNISLALPFAQALYLPVSVLSGITPLAEVPGILLTQLFYLAFFGVLSRLVFGFSVRKVTIQGG